MVGAEWYIQNQKRVLVEVFVALLNHLEEEGYFGDNHLGDDIQSWAERTLEIKLPREGPEFRLFSTQLLITKEGPQPLAVYLQRKQDGKVIKYKLIEDPS